MPGLTPAEAEDVARVINDLLEDVEDLRDLAPEYSLPAVADAVGQRTHIAGARVMLLNLVSLATGRDLKGDDAKVRDAAEMLFYACLPLLPVTGSDAAGYEVSPSAYTENVLAATTEEWVDAAFHLCQLHRRLRGMPDADGDLFRGPRDHGAARAHGRGEEGDHRRGVEPDADGDEGPGSG